MKNRSRAASDGKPWEDLAAAGSLAEELPYWGWLPDGRTCLTRAGELLSIGEVMPAVVDGRLEEDLDRVGGHWARVLSACDASTRLYFYALRRPRRAGATRAESYPLDHVAAVAQRERQEFLNGRVHDVRTYVVWSHNVRLRRVVGRGDNGQWWGFRYIQEWMRQRQVTPETVYLEREVLRAAEDVRQAVNGSCAMVESVTPIRILQATEANEVLSELVNRPGTRCGGNGTGSGLNWRLAVSELEAERRFLRLDGEPVLLYSLVTPPATATTNLLQELFCLDLPMTIALEWRPRTMEAARRKIRSAQRFYFAKRYRLLAHLQEKEGTAAAQVDAAADAEATRLGEALVELEADNVAFGELALTIAIHGELEETERRDGDVRRVFAAYDAKVIREGYGQLAVWFSRLPGQPRNRQVRSVFVSAGLATCLAPIFGAPRGTPTSKHLDKPALATLETAWGTAYDYDLFAGDVGHTLILGATGSGKSFLLNFLLVQARQYDPRILILDLGGSYRWLTQFLGGGYLELSPENTSSATALRPFALPAGERTMAFLTGWVCRLLRIGGYSVSGEDSSEVRARIEDLYAQPLHRRQLSALVNSLPKKMWPAMSRWHGVGVWGQFFDQPADGEELRLEDWHVIDLAGAADHDDWCEAALAYLLERLRLVIENPKEIGRVKIMVVDEAWRYLQDPAILNYLAEAAKTWRKRNAALVMATQSAVDVTGTQGAETLLEAMPTKIFLANPELPAAAADVFRLNSAEVDIIRGLTPKRELYLRRPREAGVLRLEVDPRSYWLYTSSARDSIRREEVVTAHDGDLARAIVALGRSGPAAGP